MALCLFNSISVSTSLHMYRFNSTSFPAVWTMALYLFNSISVSTSLHMYRYNSTSFSAVWTMSLCLFNSISVSTSLYRYHSTLFPGMTLGLLISVSVGLCGEAYISFNVMNLWASIQNAQCWASLLAPPVYLAFLCSVPLLFSFSFLHQVNQFPHTQPKTFSSEESMHGKLISW